MDVDMDIDMDMDMDMDMETNPFFLYNVFIVSGSFWTITLSARR
jgi:hypothetical protein